MTSIFRAEYLVLISFTICTVPSTFTSSQLRLHSSTRPPNRFTSASVSRHRLATPFAQATGSKPTAFYLILSDKMPPFGLKTSQLVNCLSKNKSKELIITLNNYKKIHHPFLLL